MQVNIHSTLRGREGVEEAAQIVRSCVHCGFCNATCPTYQDLHDERDGPRGRIYLLKHLLESGTAGEATRIHLDRCLTCRSCETTCPSGVQYGRLLDVGRGLAEERFARPLVEKLARRILRLILPFPRRVKALLGLARILKPILPTRLRRQVPPQQAKSPNVTSPTPMTRRMIALGGCVQAAATPRTNNAARRVLQRIGIDLSESPAAGCCGAVSYHLSAHQEGLDFMRRNIDAWWAQIEDGAEAIVVTASGCAVMVKDYGKLLRGDPLYATKASRVSEMTKDLCEVLDGEDLSVFAACAAKIRTAVHCPCTLMHGQQLNGAVERILSKAGIPLSATKDQHLCCGSAGTYSVLQPRMSQRLLARKLEALTADHPQQIVTANVGCQLHIGSVSDVPVRHWIEALDRDQSHITTRCDHDRDMPLLHP